VEGFIAIASCFEKNTVVELLKAADPNDLRPDASSTLVDKRVVDENELVGFRGDHLIVGDLYFARGLYRGRPNVVRCRPEAYEKGSGELAQAVYTLQGGHGGPIGTQETPTVPDKPVEPPEHLGVGVQAEGEPTHLEPRPEPVTEPAPVEAPPVATETIPPENVTPPPSETPAPGDLPPAPEAPTPEVAAPDLPPAPEPVAPSTPEVAPGAVQGTAGPTSLPALIVQAVNLGVADNAASLNIEELRQAIRDKGEEPVA
jgi:hypothetical protein